MIDLARTRTVVTGGAGFLGSHVVRQLLDAGCPDVVVLDDFSNGKRLHLEPVAADPRLAVVEGDIADAGVVAQVMRPGDLLIHLAVLDLRLSIKDPLRVNRTIVDGTLALLEEARRKPPSLFLNCSSSEVYGTALVTPMTEDHPRNPETPYAAAKLVQDAYCFSYHRTYGLPTVTVRPFNMYGPHSHWQGARGEAIPKFIVRAMNGVPLVLFGDGLQTRDFIYVEDAARAILAVAREPRCWYRDVNISSGRETAMRAIAEMVCRHLDLDPAGFIEYQPARPGDVRRHLGGNARLVELLGAQSLTSLEEGLKRTVDWFRSLPYRPEELLGGEVLRNWEG